MRWIFFFTVLLIISNAFAKNHITFNSHYSEKKLMELIYRTNKGAYDFKKSVDILKKNFSSPLDNRYISVQRKLLSKVFYPKLFIYPEYLDLKFSGKQFARFSEIDYLANSIKINNQEVQIKSDETLIKLHKKILRIVGAKENTQQSLRILFVLIPLMTEVKVYSFEGDLNKVKAMICKDPSIRIEDKFQVIHSFIREIEDFMKNSQHKGSCGLWANKKMQNFKEFFSDQSLVFICEKAKLALACIDNAANFRYNPETLKKKKK